MLVYAGPTLSWRAVLAEVRRAASPGVELAGGMLVLIIGP
jgi:hypothetical protein